MNPRRTDQGGMNMTSLRKNHFASFTTDIPRLAVGLLAFSIACNGSSRVPGERVGSVAEGLTADQCTFFDVNGHVTICHHTNSETHPFTVLTLSDQGCIDGHSTHAQDFVANNEPTCHGGG